jgi:hypothetical protein
VHTNNKSRQLLEFHWMERSLPRFAPHSPAMLIAVKHTAARSVRADDIWVNFDGASDKALSRLTRKRD